MRIVSQDKNIDVNYESCNFRIVGKKGRIEAFLISGSSCVLAEYDTIDRAKQVLKEMRDTYISSEYLKCGTSGVVRNQALTEDVLTRYMEMFEKVSVFEMPEK